MIDQPLLFYTIGFAPGLCPLFLAAFGSCQDWCVEGALSAVYAPATPRFTAVTNAHTHTNAATEDTTKAVIAAPI